MNYWFISDYHFNHQNIIKYENRPFGSIQEMNHIIIKKHNERVKKNDIVYFLGDWAFYASKYAKHRGEGMPIRVEEIQKQMNGNFISLRGNHDKSQNKLNISNHRIILNKGGMYIGLTHRPKDVILYDYQYYYPLNICGHIHSKWKTLEIKKNGYVGLLINVSVETNNYYPYSFNEIMSIYWRWLNNHPQKKDIQKKIKQANNRKIYIKNK